MGMTGDLSHRKFAAIKSRNFLGGDCITIGRGFGLVYKYINVGFEGFES